MARSMLRRFPTWVNGSINTSCFVCLSFFLEQVEAPRHLRVDGFVLLLFLHHHARELIDFTGNLPFQFTKILNVVQVFEAHRGIQQALIKGVGLAGDSADGFSQDIYDLPNFGLSFLQIPLGALEVFLAESQAFFDGAFEGAAVIDVLELGSELIQLGSELRSLQALAFDGDLGNQGQEAS